MKQTVVGFLFLLIGTGYTFAQQSDSIKVINPSMPVPEQRWFTKPNKSEKIFPPIISDNRLEKYPYLSTENQMTFTFDKSQKKKNIFNAPYSKFIIPTAFISYGILTRKYEWLQELDRSTHNEISEHITKKINIDDYTQFAPAVAVYGLDFMGIKAKHNFRDRTFVMATSYLLLFAGVQTIKRTTKIERPDGSNFHSFPSGHTATAFVGAHILFKEYKDASPWIGVAGYTVAGVTGAMRMYNKKHWFSDVVAGAGIGILSVEISYLLLPVFHNILGIKDPNKNLVIAPIVSNNNYGVGLAYTF